MHRPATCLSLITRVVLTTITPSRNPARASRENPNFLDPDLELGGAAHRQLIAVPSHRSRCVIRSMIATDGASLSAGRNPSAAAPLHDPGQARRQPPRSHQPKRRRCIVLPPGSTHSCSYGRGQQGAIRHLIAQKHRPRDAPAGAPPSRLTSHPRARLDLSPRWGRAPLVPRDREGPQHLASTTRYQAKKQGRGGGSTKRS